MASSCPWPPLSLRSLPVGQFLFANEPQPAPISFLWECNGNAAVSTLHCAATPLLSSEREKKKKKKEEEESKP